MSTRQMMVPLSELSEVVCELVKAANRYDASEPALKPKTESDSRDKTPDSEASVTTIGKMENGKPAKIDKHNEPTVELDNTNAVKTVEDGSRAIGSETDDYTQYTGDAKMTDNTLDVFTTIRSKLDEAIKAGALYNSAVVDLIDGLNKAAQKAPSGLEGPTREAARLIPDYTKRVNKVTDAFGTRPTPVATTEPAADVLTQLVLGGGVDNQQGLTDLLASLGDTGLAERVARSTRVANPPSQLPTGILENMIAGLKTPQGKALAAILGLGGLGIGGTMLARSRGRDEEEEKSSALNTLKAMAKKKVSRSRTKKAADGQPGPVARRRFAGKITDARGTRYTSPVKVNRGQVLRVLRRINRRKGRSRWFLNRVVDRLTENHFGPIGILAGMGKGLAGMGKGSAKTDPAKRGIRTGEGPFAGSYQAQAGKGKGRRQAAGETCPPEVLAEKKKKEKKEKKEKDD